jgi:hypothetical protein
MSNDSLTIDIDSLELERVTGGMIPIPGGGGGPTTMNIPGGGSLSCPAGTAPDHFRLKGTADGDTSLEGGLIKIHLKGSVDLQHDHCVAVPTAKRK